MTRLGLGLGLGLGLAAIAALGCGKGDKAGGGGGASARGTGVAIDADAVNSLVPAPLKDKLVFEKRDIVLERSSKTTYTLAAPKGWEHTSKMFGKLEPPKDAGMGFFTKLDVGSNCDGECKPKDWEQIADKVNFAPRAGDNVLKDEKTEGARTMVSIANDKTTVVHAWWKKGASQYYACTATLDRELKDAAPAFEKACQAVAIAGED